MQASFISTQHCCSCSELVAAHLGGKATLGPVDADGLGANADGGMHQHEGWLEPTVTQHSEYRYGRSGHGEMKKVLLYCD